MSYNNHELDSLTSQTSQNSDREGLLIFKDRQDSLFRRSEGYNLRWCRLRGNILFYLNGPEPWQNPLGVIILRNHKVSVQPQDENGHWPFLLVWENGVCYHMGTFHQRERTLWLKAMARAPYETVTHRIAELQQQLRDTMTVIELKKFRTSNKVINDFNELPLCELSLSCDNLVCDANGNPPSPFITVFSITNNDGNCVIYGCTEVIQKCSTPNFLRTIMFRLSDDINPNTMIGIMVYDMREIVTQTGVAIGSVTMSLSHILAQRLRVPLMTIENRVVGYVTFNGFSCSAASPAYTPNAQRRFLDLSPTIPAHRRSQSLPPRMRLELLYPATSILVRQNFVNPLQASYRFHSGLGGEISVHEELAEPKNCFTMPIQLVAIFLLREQEAMDNLMAFSDLSKSLTPRVVDLINNYATIERLGESAKIAQELIKTHFNAIAEMKVAMAKMTGNSHYFKPSINKVDDIPEDADLAYVPVNMHLQRMCAYNDALHKRMFHDIITVGAFTAHFQTAPKPGGLIKLLQQSNDISTRKAEMTANSNRLDAEFEKVRTMKNIQKIVCAHIDSALLTLHKGSYPDIRKSMKGIRENVKLFLDLWNIEKSVEELSKVGWDKQRFDIEIAETKKADALALPTRLRSISYRTACVDAAIATVAALISPSMAHDESTTIEAVVDGADEVGTAAGVVREVAETDSVNNPEEAVPEPADGINSAVNTAKSTVTTPDSVIFADTAKDAEKMEVTLANLDPAVLYASFNSMKMTPDVVKTRYDIDMRRTDKKFNKSEKKPLILRTVSESDLRSSSEHKVNNNRSPRNDCGKNNTTQHGAEGKVSSTSGVNAAGTGGDSAPEEAASTSGSSATATSENHGDELAAGTNSSDLNAAGHRKRRNKRQAANTSAAAQLDIGPGTSSYSDTTSSSGLTASVHNANRPQASGKSNRGKPRGTKNNRPPKPTKKIKKEAKKAQLAEASQPEGTVKMRVTSAKPAVTTPDSVIFADTAKDAEKIEVTPPKTTKLAVTQSETATTNAGKPALANLDPAVLYASFNSMKMTPDVVKTRYDIDMHRTDIKFNNSEKKTLILRTVSESDLRSSSEHKVNNNRSLRNDCGKNNTTQHGAEGKVSSTSGVNAVGTGGDSAPEEAASTSGSSATATSENHGDELAAGTNSSDLNAAGHGKRRNKRQAANTSAAAQLDIGPGTSSYSDTASSSGLTASVHNANRPQASEKSNRGKPRGTKNNRPPKPTKINRKEAKKAQLAGASQPEAKVTMRVTFKNASSKQVTTDSINFDKNEELKKDKKNSRGSDTKKVDPTVREFNRNYLKKLTDTLHDMLENLYVNLNTITVQESCSLSEFEDTRVYMDLIVKLLDEIRKLSCMAHTAMRINTETPSWSAEYAMLQTRREICFSQALTAAAAGVVCWVNTAPEENVARIIRSGLGPLLEFEGLLTLHTQENTMWGDMVVAVEDLHTVLFKLVPIAPRSPLVPQVTGSRSSLVIEIPICASLHAKFGNLTKPVLFRVTAVFFNVGINDKATLAEALGDDKPQYYSNNKNFERLSTYYLKYCQLFTHDPFRQLRVASRSDPLGEVMENLRSATQKHTTKNVEVLHLAALATRLMQGIRFTSCKSAKDRTGMAVTLEQETILSDEYHLAEHERNLARDIMRSDGCRRENTLKNIGQRKYAFTKQQVRALPEEYRPPHGSYGAGAT